MSPSSNEAINAYLEIKGDPWTDEQVLQTMGLNERELFVLLEWVKGATLKNIGSRIPKSTNSFGDKNWKSGDMGISVTRVRQIMNKAFRRLRHRSCWISHKFKSEKLHAAVQWNLL